MILAIIIGGSVSLYLAGMIGAGRWFMKRRFERDKWLTGTDYLEAFWASLVWWAWWLWIAPGSLAINCWQWATQPLADQEARRADALDRATRAARKAAEEAHNAGFSAR